MSCVKPLEAFRDARGGIVFNREKSATRIPFKLPCGSCIGCRMEHARQWGMRCLHEKKMWSRNVYVTLTYSDDNLPPYNSLCIRDVQLFMKRLRKAREGVGDKVVYKGKEIRPVRFFLGGEYGEENGRPHYHALLFNCGFRDLVSYGANKRGETLYTSRELSDMWSVDGQTLGFCTIGEVTFDSAVYCAKYMLKKLRVSDGSPEEIKEEHARRYEYVNAYGEVCERVKEFAIMSRRPGIGAFYYEKFGMEVRDLDNVVINGREVRPPRYYDVRSENIDSVRFGRFKRKRKRLAVLNRADNTAERLLVKEKLMMIAAERKERKL